MSASEPALMRATLPASDIVAEEGNVWLLKGGHRSFKEARIHAELENIVGRRGTLGLKSVRWRGLLLSVAVSNT